MAYIQATRPTKKITLPSDGKYWVEIWASLKYKEQHALGVATSGGQVDGTIAADVMLNTMIAAWNIDDEQGQVVPVTPENIELLERNDVQAILEAITELVDVDEAGKKSSPKTSPKPSQEPAT